MPDNRLPKSDEAVHLTAQQARGGDVVLTTPARRAVFIGGLVLLIVVAIAGYWMS